jgi:hypothetical protein
MSKFSGRSFTSLLLTFAFAVVVATGLVLWLAHSPETFGIGKGVWKHTHIFVSLLMVVAGVTHLCLNWSSLWGYFWSKTAHRMNRKWELAAAVVAMVLVISLASLEGDHGDMQRLGGMNLQQIAQNCNKSVDDIVAMLKKDGIDVHNPADSILEISQHNNRSPMAIVSVLQREVPEALRPPRGTH